MKIIKENGKYLDGYMRKDNKKIKETIERLKSELWERLPKVSDVMRVRIIPKFIRKVDIKQKEILCDMFWESIKNVKSQDEVVRNMMFMLNALEPPKKNPKFTGKSFIEEDIEESDEEVSGEF
jgi:hypothetical protein